MRKTSAATNRSGVYIAGKSFHECLAHQIRYVWLEDGLSCIKPKNTEFLSKLLLLFSTKPLKTHDTSYFCRTDVMRSQYAPVRHSAEFSKRRRALFPIDENSGSKADFGSFNLLSDTDDEDVRQQLPLNKTIGDYDIIGLLNKESQGFNTPDNNPSLSQVTENLVTPNTVLKESPSQTLKTPQELLSAVKLPKLVRKGGHQVDAALIEDNAKAKVRTALFPELDMSLSVQSFYPQTESPVSSRAQVRQRKANPTKSQNRQADIYLCNRRKSKGKAGTINAGVKHQIRKSKSKKLSKEHIIQAALNIINSSPLNAVLDNTSQQAETRKEATPEPETQLVVEREPSPEPEPDPTKRFFKSARRKGVVTVNPNLKVEVSTGKMNIIMKRNLKRCKPQCAQPAKKVKLDTPTFDDDNMDTIAPPTNIISIINNLEDKATNSLGLMSPTSEMCNMTSGLALNSPKKAKNLNAVLEALPAPNKLFPIFRNEASSERCHQTPKVVPIKSSAKKLKPLPKGQMMLDAGQKRWGATQCFECKFIYNMGDPGEEIAHNNYHDGELIFRFSGWKNERVVSNVLLDGKIVQVVPGDSKMWLKKVKDVLGIVNRELGYFDLVDDIMNYQTFFYVKNKIIIGVMVAEVRSRAHRLLTTQNSEIDFCSEESYGIKCGIVRIWVNQNHRRQGIATALLNCVKRNFVMGYILRDEDIALSSPTDLGKQFGQHYFKTPNFLIYSV